MALVSEDIVLQSIGKNREGVTEFKKEKFNDCSTTTAEYKGGISLTLFRCNEKRFVSVSYIDSKLEQENAFEEKNKGLLFQDFPQKIYFFEK